MSWLSSFLHPSRGYKSAQEQLNNYYQQAQQYQQPFINNAQNAYGGLSEAQSKLLDPAALQAEWMNTYQMSPQAQQAQQLATQSGLDAASSMGLMGSSPALSSLQEGASSIGLKDRDNYLNSLMDKYKTGIGLGENIYGTGASSASQMGQNAMNMGQNSAQMAFGQQNAQGDLLAKLLGGAAGLFGGPLASAAGTGFSQMTGWSPTGNYVPWNSFGGN